MSYLNDELKSALETLARDRRELTRYQRNIVLGEAELADARRCLLQAHTPYVKTVLRECVIDTRDELASARDDARQMAAEIKDDQRIVAEIRKELARVKT